MKKQATLIILIMMMVLLTGCCTFGHEFADATCNAPKICVRCGKTEGEPRKHEYTEASCNGPATCMYCGKTKGVALSHDFDEATCDKPKTCKLCGKTEGEPLGHKANEATRLEASVCSRCGEVLSEKIKPDYEAFDCGVEVKSGDTVDVKAGLFDSDDFVDAKVTLIDCGLIDDSAGKYLTKLGTPDGYEWHKAMRVYEAQNDSEYYLDLGFNNEDYYDVKLHDDTMNYTEIKENAYYGEYTVNVDGIDYPECVQLFVFTYDKAADGSEIDTISSYTRIPIGYDGAVVGAYSKDVKWGDGQYVTDVAADGDFYYIRLTNTDSAKQKLVLKMEVNIYF